MGTLDVEFATNLVALADNPGDFVVIEFNGVVRIVDKVVTFSVKRGLVWAVVDLEVRGLL